MNMSKKVACAACLAASVVGANFLPAQPRPMSSTATAAALQPAGSDEIFARWDKDHSKTLTREEFKAGWQEVQATMLVFKLHENFVLMDSNKTGVLEATEYANLELIRKAGASAPPMSKFDADKSQTLNFKEYLGLVRTLAKGQP